MISVIKTIQLTNEDTFLMISSIKYSLIAIDEKFKKFNGVVLVSELDEREQENYFQLKKTRNKYMNMIKVLESIKS